MDPRAAGGDQRGLGSDVAGAAVAVGLLLGASMVAGEVLRYLALGPTDWVGRQGWPPYPVLLPGRVGTYAGITLRTAIDPGVGVVVQPAPAVGKTR